MAKLLESEMTGAVAVKMRQKAGMNQGEFWGVFGVTQSGGSRYESGRRIPKPVRMLLAGAWSTEGAGKLNSTMWMMASRMGRRSSTNRGRGHAGIRKAAGQGRTRQHAA